MGSLNGTEFGVGGSFTENALPSAFTGVYGGDPFSSKVFLQLGGMEMWGI
jgi:hypothetical protein